MIKHINEINIEKVNAGSKAFIQVLLSPEETPNFAMRRFIIEPGGEIPKHVNQVEHEQYVLNGHAEVCIGEDVYIVNKNDVVFIPANVPHWYKVLGEEPFEFLCLVPNKLDKIEFVE